MKIAILLAAALSLAAANNALAERHFGNNGVETAPSDGADAEAGEFREGNNRGLNSKPPQVEPSCPEEPDGTHDPRRGRHLCGQPPSTCNAPEGAACLMIAPAPRTYPNCAALIVANARLLHFGRCENEPAPEPVRISVGFEVKNMRQCLEKVNRAKRLKPKLAPWLQADGKPLRTREFCKRLFGEPAAGSGNDDPVVSASEDANEPDEEAAGDEE
jgi:hypothetical protein